MEGTAGTLVALFIKGGKFMWPLLAALVLGVAIIIERLWTLTRASINTRKFMRKLKAALEEGGTGSAASVCENTRGPIASVLHAGLLRADRGIDHVEKAITDSGAVEMAYLERGMVWLATVANIAPMLGFLGTVSGMINAFEAIAAAGDVEPTVVASGISEALITTASGLTIAIPVQMAYNYFTSKVNRLVVEMEESAADLVDTLIEMEHQAKKAAS